MEAVHFGAGNIGRGFIGLLLHQAGYDVCFVDVNKELVEEINQRKEYTILFADEDKPGITVNGIRALDASKTEQIIEAIAEADLVTTAVGPHILPTIAPLLAEGISRRLSAGDRPLQIIACENMIRGSSFLKKVVFEHLPEELVGKVSELIGFPDAAVDRIVPLQKHEDILTVTVEPFAEWVVDQTQIIGDIPEIQGMTRVNNLDPYIERKLFTVNTGHAIAAYLGRIFGLETISQAMCHPFINYATRQALKETGALLVAKHQLDPKKHEQYIEKIVRRFENRFITDQVIRVGRSPIRKLAANDRLVAPAREAIEYGIHPANLGLGIASALLFDYSADQEVVEIQRQLQKSGWEKTINRFTGITRDNQLFPLVIAQISLLQR